MKEAFHFTAIEKTAKEDQYKINGRVLIDISLDTPLFILRRATAMRIDKIIFYGTEFNELQAGCTCDLIISTKLSMVSRLSMPYINEYLYVE